MININYLMSKLSHRIPVPTILVESYCIQRIVRYLGGHRYVRPSLCPQFYQLEES